MNPFVYYDSAVDPSPVHRVCVACRQTTFRQSMLRFIRVSASQSVGVVLMVTPLPERHPVLEDVLAEVRLPLTPLPRSMAQGRSAYLCLNKDCIVQALKARRLGRSLKTGIPDGIVKALANVK